MSSTANLVSLRELIDQAIADLDRYKHPDTSEVERRLDEILTAGKLGSIAHDHLEDLSFYKGDLCISTSYSVRGCTQSGQYKIPEAVIDSFDPIATIKVWAKDQRVAAARLEVASAERSLQWRKDELARAEAEEIR